MSKEKISNAIKTEANRLGFDSCGFSEATFLEEEANHLEQWLKDGNHAQMKYMENHFDKRLDPRLLMENTQSVISLTYNYFPSKKQSDETYKIASYAYGKDYHKVVKKKLKALELFISKTVGEVACRSFVDSAPILERAWAERSGLGWRGKNSLLIQKTRGSFFFIAIILVDLNLDYNNPFKADHCGTCTRCIDACPTNAIEPSRTVNSNKCISYHTIEHKEQFEKKMGYQFENWIFGCDICQDVCPWNQFSKPHNEPEFTPSVDLLNYTKLDWEQLNSDKFNIMFSGSAVKRTKFEGLKRNIEYVKNQRVKI